MEQRKIKHGIFENDFSYPITKYASRGYNLLEVAEDDETWDFTALSANVNYRF